MSKEFPQRALREMLRKRKIAAALEVSVDFLIGNYDNFIKDKALLKRVNEILNLSDKDREHVFALLDAFLRDTRAKKVYS